MSCHQLYRLLFYKNKNKQTRDGRGKKRSDHLTSTSIVRNVFLFLIYFFLWPFILELLLSVGFIFPRRLLLLTFIYVAPVLRSPAATSFPFDDGRWHPVDRGKCFDGLSFYAADGVNVCICNILETFSGLGGWL
jgi:hypothetical protein